VGVTEPETKNPLPYFGLPPVIEVVIGVQYDPLPIPTVAIGQFWATVRDQYPRASDHPLIASPLDRDDRVPGIELTGDAFDAPPLPRVMLEDSSGSWVVQIQQDRLLYNWRKTKEEDEYPRFQNVHPRFRASWNAWVEFLALEHGLHAKATQIELTYVNHVPRGNGWKSVDEIGRVFPSASWQTNGEFLPAPDILAWRAQFQLPDNSGKLHVALQQGVRLTDRQPVLLCELTARGMPRDDDLEAWLRVAHEWIVRGFTDLTSPAVQELWKRRV
jgi:uncharacterized protein (TIGR04255 family)